MFLCLALFCLLNGYMNTKAGSSLMKSATFVFSMCSLLACFFLLAEAFIIHVMAMIQR